MKQIIFLVLVMICAFGLKVRSSYDTIDDPNTYTESEYEVFEYWYNTIWEWASDYGYE